MSCVCFCFSWCILWVNKKWHTCVHAFAMQLSSFFSLFVNGEHFAMQLFFIVVCELWTFCHVKKNSLLMNHEFFTVKFYLLHCLRIGNVLQCNFLHNLWIVNTLQSNFAILKKHVIQINLICFACLAWRYPRQGFMKWSSWEENTHINKAQKLQFNFLIGKLKRWLLSYLHHLRESLSLDFFQFFFVLVWCW